jgi:2-C-methyl-D-erythritol 4-phosphate cytidylyltransferase
MKVIAIILAGGTGSRLQGYRKPKQFLPLGKCSLLGHSLRAFQNSKKVSKAVLTLPKEHWKEGCALVQREGFGSFVSCVEGGKTRQESVWKALEWLQENDVPDIVLIHDAARPFVTKSMIEKSIRIAMQYGAVEVVVPTIDTIIESDGKKVSRVLERNALFSVQTPQTFRFQTIWDAHQKALEANIRNVSDDAQLLLRLGQKVKILEGSYDNFKITTPRDYEFAKMILSTKGKVF